LGVQIRKQTAESRLAATRELSDSYRASLEPCFKDRELSALNLKAIQNYEELPRDDRYRMAMYIQSIMRMFEQHHVHIQHHKVEQAFVDSMNLSFQEWLTFPGIQRWWELTSDMFEPRFREYVDQMVEKAKVRGHISTFKAQ
jgi:hypothetical protein